MTFFRQYIAPLIVVLVFLFALVAVSARIFLPADMAAPAPIELLPPLLPSSAAGLSLRAALPVLIQPMA